MRLIYAEDLIQDSEDILTWEMLARINKAETIDAEPVRHGHWIVEADGGTRCSACRQTVREDSSGIYKPVDMRDMPYCPKCGAKMDEEGE